MGVIQILIIFFFTLDFCQKHKKSNRNHDIFSETFNFTLVELKLKNYLEII